MIVNRASFLKSASVSSMIVLLSFGAFAQERSWEYSYNSKGKRVSQDGPRTDVNDIKTFTYYSDGSLRSVTNAVGHTVTYNEYNAEGFPISITDEKGVTRELSYSWSGNVVESQILHPSGDSSLDEKTTYEYDSGGNLVALSQPERSPVRFEYDDKGHLVSVIDDAGGRINYTLDESGNRVGETILDKGGKIRFKLERAFDGLDHVMDVTGSNGQNSHFDRDGNGNIVVSTDGRNNSTKKIYDSLNRVSKVTNSEGGETLYTYNEFDQVKSVEDPEGLVTSYEYDKFGNLTRVDSPDSGVVSYTYDSAGNRISSVDARGVLVKHEYDAINRLTNVVFPDNPSSDIEYIYDETDVPFGTGMLTSVSNGFASIHYRYNHRGQITKKISSIDELSLNVQYEYDASGAVTKVVYPSGLIVKYNVDGQGRVTGVGASNKSGADLTPVAHGISYLPFGPIESFTYGNDLIQSTTFDLDFRVSKISVAYSEPLMNRLYEYDANDNISSLSGGGQENVSSYYSYDNLDRVSGIISMNDLISYEYDGVGNRTLYSFDGNESIYEYKNNSHHLISNGNEDFLYDPSGNTIGKGEFRFEYDLNGRLSAVRHDDDVISEYSYNPLGQRVAKAVGSNAGQANYAELADEQDAIAEQYRNQIDANIERRQEISLEVQNIYTEIDELTREKARVEVESEEAQENIVTLEKKIDEAIEKSEELARLSDSLSGLIEPNPDFLQRIINNVYEEASAFFEERSVAYMSLAQNRKNEKDDLTSIVEENEYRLAAISEGTSDLDRIANELNSEIESIDKEVEQAVILAESAEQKAKEYREKINQMPSDNEKTFFVYNERGQVLGEYRESGEAIREYVWLKDSPLVLAANDEFYYFHNDHLNTPKLLTDSDQNVVWKASYSSFGEATVLVDDVTQNLRLPGQYFDKETGLHYNYYRTYDPGTGRYLQSDPIGLSGGTNTYAYALQNPLRYTDPFGLVSWNCSSFNSGVGLAAVGAGIIRYRCESECVDGSKTIAEIQVKYAGVNFGLQAGMVGSSNNEITDGNTYPDADVFNGEYFESGANYTVGIGYGVSAVSFNRGEAKGANHGIVGGVGAGAGEASGTSRVLSEVKVECDEECEF